MKKRNDVSKKLVVSRETVRGLSSQDLGVVVGGSNSVVICNSVKAMYTYCPTCPTYKN